jgi:hypothetical protein
MAKVEKLLDIKAELEAQERIAKLRLKDIRLKLEKVGRELQLACKHPKKKETSSYFNGSYEELARTFYTLRCCTCDKALDTWDEAHSYYG